MGGRVNRALVIGWAFNQQDSEKSEIQEKEEKMALRIADFKLPEQLDKYRLAIRDYVQRELDPIADEIENTGKIPATLWPSLQESGLLRLAIPTNHGGFGLKYSQYFPILEEVAKTHGTIRLIVHAWNWLMFYQILKYGTEEQKKNILPRLASGELLVAWALTEPGTGTGADMKSRAEKDGDSFIINGHKHMISFALCAELFIIFAITDPAKGRKGFSSFVVEKGTKGFNIIPHGEPMGLRGYPHGWVGKLDFDNCRLPSKNLIGPVGSGLQQAFEALDISRLSIGVSCLGLSQRFLELSIQQAKSRVTFGKVIAQRQAVQQMIAETATNIEALRALVRDVTRRMEEGQNVSKECSMSKLFGIRTVREASDMGLEIHGGVGYTRDLRIERMYRDARGPWLEEGTPAVQRTVIAKEIFAQE